MGYGYFPYVQGGIFPVIQDATGQQLIKLSYGAGMTTLEGATNIGDDLRLKANETEDYDPYNTTRGWIYGISWSRRYCTL